MQFLHLLFLAAATLLGCASAEDMDAPSLESRSSKCGKVGSRLIPAYFVSRQTALMDATQCGALCRNSVFCGSYSVSKMGCGLYIPPIFVIFKLGTGQMTFYEPACFPNRDLCNIRGDRNIRPIAESGALLDNSWTGCMKLCRSNTDCRSFSLGSSTCRLYSSSLKSSLKVDDRSNIAFWDVKCADAIADYPAFYTPTSKVPEIKFTEAVKTATVPAAHTPLVTDSPPYTPTGRAPAHGGYANDDDLTDSYTYTEFELPTLAAMGSDPVTTGIPQPTYEPAPCMMSTGPQAQFTLLDSNFVPIVSKTMNQIGPVAQPTVQPEASDPLSGTNPQDITFPAFYLQAPVGGASPADTYDLVYAGKTTQFVAMDRSGRLVLTGQSTGARYANNLVTTIFGTDCNGKMTIKLDGQSYSWASDGRYIQATPGGGKGHMLALPVNHPTVEKAKRDKTRLLARAKTLQDKLERRGKVVARDLEKRLMDGYQTGVAPKCPAAPDNLVPYVKADHELNQGNVCNNLPDWWQLSPFSFDGSCMVQSLCFDQCQSYGWESCTGIFTVMAMTSCVKNFGGSWWDIIPLVACTAQATYFSVYTGTQPGKELFYKAQKSMCVCYCGNIGDTCLKQDGNFYCVNLKGSDDNNCGNCGRQCGPNSKCRGGECGCPVDQCGTTCLDLRNNPNNCGMCGNVCNPKYCVNGSCYVPKPGTCAPDPPIVNGNFRNNWFTNWELDVLPNQPGCTKGDNVIVGSSTDYLYSHNFFPRMSSLPGSGCAASIVQRKVKLCPGFKYELKFDARYVIGETTSAGTFIGTAKCTITWALGTNVSATNFGPYQSNTREISDSRYLKYSGWTFNINKGDAGVTKKSENFYVDLIGVVYCMPRKADDGGAVVVSGIDIQQVGIIE